MRPEESEMTRSRCSPSWLHVTGVAGFVAVLLVSPGCQKSEKSPADASSKSAGKVIPSETTAPKKPGEPDAKNGAFAPIVEIQEADYAQARSRFHTKLTRKGPSP